MIDINTIGAGGGSIAYVDAGGAFRVGPRSAGADPGPACYGQGGIEPTITDANVVLGRLDPERFLGGGMRSIATPRSRPSSGSRELGLACSRRRKASSRSRTSTWPRDPVADGREGPRPARVRARRLRRRRAAARGRGRRDARDPGGDRPAASRHHLRDGPADERPQVRPDAHRLPAEGASTSTGSIATSRRSRRSCGSGSARRRPRRRHRGLRGSTAATSARATSCGSH